MIQKKVNESEHSLFNKIQNHLDQTKRMSNVKIQNEGKHRKSQTGLSSTLGKNTSSEKRTKVSDSYQNLLPKRGEKLIFKKNNRQEHAIQKINSSFSHQSVQPIQQSKNSKSVYFTQQNVEKDVRQSMDPKSNIKIQDSFVKNNELPIKFHAHNIKYNEFQNLKLDDINSLIQLIDNCVQQANSYISHLTTKLQLLNNELNEFKAAYIKLQQAFNLQIKQLNEKQSQIKGLISQRNNTKAGSINQQMKGLLKLIEELNNSNMQLKKQNDELKLNNQQNKTENIKLLNPNSKEMYNQIHRKIDIFNISINENKSRQQQIKIMKQDVVRKGRYSKNGRT